MQGRQADGIEWLDRPADAWDGRNPFKGHVWWHYGLAMAVANVAGSLIGTRVALRHGAGFVRIVFMVVVSALILKTAYDAFLK